MRYFFVHESGKTTEIIGTNAREIAEHLSQLTEQDPNSSGVIGAIEEKSGKVRASLLVHRYRGKPYRTAISDFVRKYHALGILEQKALEYFLDTKE